MDTGEFSFNIGNFPSTVIIQDELPSIPDIIRRFSPERGGSHNALGKFSALAVCDDNTEAISRAILEKDRDGKKIPLLVLESGEKSKTWESVEAVIRAGRAAGLGRDGIFIGIGGGGISDLSAFAASIYMRGAKLCLVSTTLLGMVDASLGGKTGIDLLGLKNLAGTFYPASLVIAPLAALDSLPEAEWKSGMAELIKTAILDSDEFLQLTKELIRLTGDSLHPEKGGEKRNSPALRSCLKECISRAVACKGSIVQDDPRETGSRRALLNLGHTFGHALESVAGFGNLSHGEAVAWGIARACELGMALGITPAGRSRDITETLVSCGFEIKTPHPRIKEADFADALFSAMGGDKKIIAGKLRFIVPAAESAQIVSLPDEKGPSLLHTILNGE